MTLWRNVMKLFRHDDSDIKERLRCASETHDKVTNQAVTQGVTHMIRQGHEVEAMEALLTAMEHRQRHERSTR